MTFLGWNSLKMQAIKDFYLRKVYRCTCTLHLHNQIFESGFRTLNDILSYLQELDDFSSEKIYCVCRNEKKDLPEICEQNLKVAVLVTFKFNCTSNKKTDFIILEIQKSFCKGCRKWCWEKMAPFFHFVYFNNCKVW